MFLIKHLNKNTIFLNSFYLYLSHFADYVLALFFIPYIAKTIGAVEFGKIGLAQSFGILIILLIEFGSPIMATRKVASVKKNKEAIKKFIDEIFTFKILLIPLIILLSLVATFFIPTFSNHPIYLLIVVLGSIFHGVSPSWYFHGIQKMKNVALSKITFRSTGFIFILFFVKSPADSWIVLLSYALTSFLIFIYLNLIIIRKYGAIRLTSLNAVMSIFWESLSTFLISVVPVIYQNISLFIASVFVNPAYLGFYYGANRIYRAFNTLYGPISQAFFPALSSANTPNKFKLKNLIKKYFLLMILIGTLFFLINFFLAEFIILNFLGKDFSGAVELLKLFSIVLPLTAVSNSIGRQWLLATNKDFYYFSIQSFSSIIAFSFFLLNINGIGIKALPTSIIIFEVSTIISVLLLIIFKK